MSTFIQLIVEVTTGDDLPLADLKRDEVIAIVTGPGATGTGLFDTVKATVHSVAYIPPEALE